LCRLEALETLPREKIRAARQRSPTRRIGILVSASSISTRGGQSDQTLDVVSYPSDQRRQTNQDGGINRLALFMRLERAGDANIDHLFAASELRAKIHYHEVDRMNSYAFGFGVGQKFFRSP